MIVHCFDVSYTVVAVLPVLNEVGRCRDTVCILSHRFLYGRQNDIAEFGRFLQSPSHSIPKLIPSDVVTAGRHYVDLNEVSISILAKALRELFQTVIAQRRQSMDAYSGEFRVGCQSTKQST